MKDIKVIRGKHLIPRLIEEGEHVNQDFKFQISDARKIARSISAFANNSGGRLLIGVKDNGNIAGVRSEEDIYMIEQAAQLYCRPAQHIDFTAYQIDGAIVVKADIAPAANRPILAQEPDKSWSAYYRVADENILAPAIMVKAWRRQAASSGSVITFTEAESALLRFLDQWGMTTLDDYIRGAHISQAAAEDIIINLYAIGIIDFTHTPSGFKITRR